MNSITSIQHHLHIFMTSGSGELCGYTEFERNLPAPIITSSNVVKIKIVTDSTSQSQGFQFIITPINSKTITNGYKLNVLYGIIGPKNEFQISNSLFFSYRTIQTLLDVTE